MHMLAQCAQHGSSKGIYVDLTDDERRGLLSVDSLGSTGVDYLREIPHLGSPDARPIDPDAILLERGELGLSPIPFSAPETFSVDCG